MILCGVDVETTGLSTEKDFITELGYVIKKHGMKKPLSLYQNFVHVDGQPPISAEITELTGIENWMIDAYAYEPNRVLTVWLNLCKRHKVEGFVGMNCRSFDKAFLDRYVHAYLNDEALFDYYKSIPWLDIKSDIEYPRSVRTRNLIGLAAEHGFLNPYPHAAVFDSMTTLKVLDNYDVKDVFGTSQEPRQLVYANVGFTNKDLAKNRGFYYKPDTKVWWKEIRASQLEAEIAANTAAGFETRLEA